jgi:hypothetical protein
VFRSRLRPVVYPQAEHARLAATIAAAWGNDAFERPPLPFTSFVHGVALHDRGYGELDADGIGEVPLARWLEIQQRSFAPTGEDAVVDLVAGLHVRRLVAWRRDDAARAVVATFDAALPGLYEAAGVPPAAAAAADRVTDLCDRLAFDLCAEEATDGAVEVLAARAGEPVTVVYALDGRGGVTLDPWPLGVPWLTVVVGGFAADGYPQRLAPVATLFRLAPRR